MSEELSNIEDPSILYVTANASQAEVFSRQMQRETEFNVLTNNTVNEALEILHSRKDIACIVSDYDLPDIDGLTFLQSVRAQFTDLPFILFTSEGNEKVASQAIAARVTDYLIKEQFQDQWAELASLIQQSISFHQSQRPLAAPEVRAKVLLEASPDPIAILQDGTFSYANSNALGLFEVDTLEELTDLRVEDVVVPDYRSKTTGAIEAIQDRDINVDRLETAIIGQQGTETPVELTAVSMEWGGSPAILLISRDISDRKGRIMELHRYRQVVQKAGQAIYVTDRDGTIEYVNPAFEETTGFTGEEAVGETPRILNSGEMREGYFEELWKTVCSGEVWKEEIINRRKNGETYTAMQTIAPVSDDDDIHAFVAIQEDITERIEQEETLQRRTRAVAEAPIGITISDPDQADNPLIYANDAFVDLTGYPRAEVLGANCRFLQGKKTDPDRIDEIREAINAQNPISIDIRNYRKDGTEFWNHLEIAPVRNDAGEVVNFIGFQQDITERKERQEQLAVIDRVLRHNLRNDMNVIAGRAAGIRSTTSGDVADSADEIIAVSDRLVGLAEKQRRINQLLVERPTRKEIMVGERLRQVVSSLRSEYSDATITIECPDGITVQPTAQFGEAVSELVRNAIIHTESASPEVTITVTQSEEASRIEITDTGPEIPEVERDLLLDETEQTPLHHGSGLGLWFVRLVISQSGGTITYEENSPRGNTVGIELPR